MTDMIDEQDAPPTQQRRVGYIATKVPLVVAIAIAVVFHLQTRNMDIGSLTEPGPGFWPRVLIIGIIAASALGFVVDLGEGIESFELTPTARVLGGFMALVVFTLMFEQTGAILAGFVFMMLWLKGLNGESWRLSILISAITPIVCYLLFVTALGVRLPEDIVASLWGGR